MGLIQILTLFSNKNSCIYLTHREYFLILEGENLDVNHSVGGCGGSSSVTGHHLVLQVANPEVFKAKEKSVGGLVGLEGFSTFITIKLGAAAWRGHEPVQHSELIRTGGQRNQDAEGEGENE